MRVRVDATSCQPSGVCREVAPELFVLDEWGYASVVGDGSVTDEQREGALRAVRECPAQAVHADEAEAAESTTAGSREKREKS